MLVEAADAIQLISALVINPGINTQQSNVYGSFKQLLVAALRCLEAPFPDRASGDLTIFLPKGKSNA